MSIQNISENSQQKQKQSQPTFQQMFQQRVNQLQSKLNKYCSVYDSLMPLLAISNIFPQLSSYDKQLQTQYKKVQKCTQILQENDKRSSQIDKNYWERQIKQISTIIQVNQQEIKNILIQTNNNNKGLNKQDQLNKQMDKIRQDFHKQIQYKLAQHKNNIQLQRISQRSQQNKHMTYEYISQSIQKHFIPINMELNQIQEQISLLNLLLPKRDIKKFHQFNYNRLMYQISKLNKSLQKILQSQSIHKQSSHSFQSSQSQYPQSQYQSKQLLSQIHIISKQIQQIKSQIEGSDQKYKKQLALMFYQNINYNKYECLQIDQQIKKDMQEIVEKFKDVNFKYNKLKSIVQNKSNLSN